MLLALHRTPQAPLHRQIYEALKAGIRNGQFGPGTRLPSTRALCADLKVSRNTVLSAYEQLLAEGYAVSRERATTVVADAVPPRAQRLAAPAETVTPPRLSAYAQRLTREPSMPPSGSYAARPGLRHDFRYGKPAVDDFPHDPWRRLLAAHAKDPSSDSLGYAAPAGHAALRAALAEYLNRARGLH